MVSLYQSSTLMCLFSKCLETEFKKSEMTGFEQWISNLNFYFLENTVVQYKSLASQWQLVNLWLFWSPFAWKPGRGDFDGKASDVFSLGLVLFEVATLTLPFTSKELMEDNLDVKTNLKNDGLNGSFVNFLLQFLQWDPKKRVKLYKVREMKCSFIWYVNVACVFWHKILCFNSNCFLLPGI